ncbi:MAG: TolC family outer membrane protein [Gallionella sp.]|nr:TolC family outer membrane protein [Gallionella sp.]
MSYLIFIIRVVLALSACLVALPAQALTLTEAIRLARQSDPVLLSAEAALAASQERTVQASANLLPQVSVTANTMANRRDYEIVNTLTPVAKDRYNSNSVQLSVTQPLVSNAATMARVQADAALTQSAYQYKAVEQDMLVRLAQAWFDVMLARDIADFASAQAAAAKLQWEQTMRATELKIEAGPALEGARSKYDQAVSDSASAEADESINAAMLEQIIGTLKVFEPPFLPDDYVMAEFHLGTLEQWLSQAETESPAILAALSALEAAQDEVKKQRAGHDPTLDIVATYGNNYQAVGTFPGQSGYDIKQRAIGLQLNIPLFAGGGQDAKIREALAMSEKAAQDLETARRSVRLAAKQAWFGWLAGNAHQKAALQSMRFAMTSLASATDGKSKGIKTELDILQARQQLYGARRDLQKSRYELITSYFKLKSAAGALKDADLVAFDAWFARGENKTDWSRLPDGVADTP